MLYLERQSFSYDAELVRRTMATVLQVLFGKKQFREIPEMAEIRNRGKIG